MDETVYKLFLVKHCNVMSRETRLTASLPQSLKQAVEDFAAKDDASVNQ